MEPEVRYGGPPRKFKTGATKAQVHVAQGSVQTDSTEETPRIVMRGISLANGQRHRRLLAILEAERHPAARIESEAIVSARSSRRDHRLHRRTRRRGRMRENRLQA